MKNKTAAFDLELAKLGHPLITSGGIKVKDFYVFDDFDIFTCIVIAGNSTYGYRRDGSYLHDKPHENDLLLDLSISWERPFIKGDLVEVQDIDADAKHWTKRVYLFSHDSYHYCVAQGYETYKCRRDGSIVIAYWGRVRHIKKKEEVKVEVTIMINGEKANLSDISEDTLLALRNK